MPLEVHIGGAGVDCGECEVCAGISQLKSFFEVHYCHLESSSFEETGQNGLTKVTSNTKYGKLRHMCYSRFIFLLAAGILLKTRYLKTGILLKFYYQILSL